MDWLIEEIIYRSTKVNCINRNYLKRIKLSESLLKSQQIFFQNITFFISVLEKKSLAITWEFAEVKLH